jgi:protein involved in polysaccharide export with SLBB domain
MPQSPASPVCRSVKRAAGLVPAGKTAGTGPAARPDRGGRRPALACLAGLLLAALSGCAAISNPVADGIPVRRIPPELLGRPREEERTIPLTWLRQKPADVYRLDAGDLLGVYVEGVLGERGQLPPVRVGEAVNLPPAIGYPIPVREDGTLPLPLVQPVPVRGLTLEEAQAAVIEAYTVKQKLLTPPAENKVIVTLLRQRQYHIVVVRQDSGGLVLSPTGGFGNTKRGTGATLELPAGENDVLNALTRTGGLPGLDAMNEVIIQRGGKGVADTGDVRIMPADPTRSGPDASTGGVTCDWPTDELAQQRGLRLVRIPLRLRPGDAAPFRPEDVLLQSGDIVFIESRDTELFYTGGLLPPRQFPLPRDYDLDVVQAVAFAAGPLVSGGFNSGSTALTGTTLQAGLGFPSPSLLSVVRRVPGTGQQFTIRVDLNKALRDPRERILVQSGDLLILQETPGEAIGRYVSTVFRLNFLGTIIRQRDLTGTSTLSLP